MGRKRSGAGGGSSRVVEKQGGGREVKVSVLVTLILFL